jgi:hypothetical protein
VLALTLTDERFLSLFADLQRWQLFLVVFVLFELLCLLFNKFVAEFLGLKLLLPSVINSEVITEKL